MGGQNNAQNSARFRTPFDFHRKYLWNGSTQRISKISALISSSAATFALTICYSLDLSLQTKAQYTPLTPTQLNSTVESRRRRRCVLGISHLFVSHILSFLHSLSGSIWTALSDHEVVLDLVSNGILFVFNFFFLLFVFGQCATC